MAFLTIIILLIYFSSIGYAAISLTRSLKRTPLNDFSWMDWTASPAVGIFLVISLVMILNKAGLPVNQFATLLLAAMGLISIGIISTSVKFIKSPYSVSIAYIAIAGALLVGWPTIIYGWNWLSFGNDDMATYVLGAMRYLHRGYYDLPDINNILKGEFPADVIWFFHTLQGHRHGQDLLIATCSDLFGRHPSEVFMSVIITVHIATALAILPVIIRRDNINQFSVVVIGLCICLVPLFLFGTCYQLIAQDGGLCFWFLQVSSLYRLIETDDNKKTAYFCLATSFGGAFIFYPEITPFMCATLICAFIFCLIIPSKNISLKNITWGKLSSYLLISLVIIALCNSQIENSLMQARIQASASSGMGSTGAFGETLFPFYLMPSGAANFWGILPYGANGDSLQEQILILLSFALSCVFLYGIIIAARKRQISLFAISLVSVSVGCYLFAKGNAFGTYKMAMYASVPAAITMINLIQERLSPLKSKTVIIIYFLLNFSICTMILLKSTGLSRSSFTEAKGGTEEKFIAQSIKNQNEFDSKITEIRVPNPTAQKLLMSYPPLKDGICFSTPDQIVGLSNIGWNKDKLHLMSAEYYSQGLALSRTIDETSKLRFTILNFPGIAVQCEVPLNNSANNILQIGESQISSDARTLPSTIYKIDKRNPLSLNFVSSNLGTHYYSSGTKISYYQIEKDPSRVGDFRLMGRYSVWQLSENVDNISIRLSGTCSNMPIKEQEIPPVRILGTNIVALPAIGFGGIDFTVSGIKPLVRNGRSFILLDLGRESTFFESHKRGIMRLYGLDVRFDGRRGTMQVRDFFPVAAGNEANQIKNFEFLPMDLSSNFIQSVGYSGIYDDGWVNKIATIYLRNMKPSSVSCVMEIAGSTPIEAKNNYLKITVDNMNSIDRNIEAGNFKLKIPLSFPSNSTVKISLEGTLARVISDEDPRTASFRIEKIITK